VSLVGLALLVPLLAIVGSSAASAEPVGCQPSPETGCLAGTLRAGETLAEVEISVSGPGIDTSVTSGPDGRWSAEITEEGQYTVTVVEETLPEGVSVAGPITVDASLGRNNPVLFRLVGESDGTVGGGRTGLIIQSAVSGLRLGLLLALAAVGLSLIYGTTGLSSFSHAEQVTLGGIVAFMMVNWWGLPFLLAAVLTVLFCGLTGYLQHLVLWKPLRHRGLGLVQLMIVTIGLSLAMQYMYQVMVGAGTVRIIRAAPTPITWGPVRLTDQSLWAMGVSIVVLTIVGLALLRTRLGRATRAVSDNPALAEASGIDVDNVVRLVWITATALAGLAGIMLALVLNGVKWDSGMQILLLLFAAVTLGGLGTAFGALVGAIVIGLVVELTPAFGFPGDLKYAAALLILILILLVRPQGLLGKAARVG
jgi:neutral amino acid transport system permease protein